MTSDLQATRAERERARRQAARKGRLQGWLIPIVVGLAVAAAFLIGTRYAPRPVAPVASRVIKTECKIDTTEVQATVEQLRAAVNARRAHHLRADQFEHRVSDTIPKVGQAVRRQGVTCRTVP